MNLSTIQIALSKIVLTLQALALLTMQAQHAPWQYTFLIPRIEQTLTAVANELGHLQQEVAASLPAAPVGTNVGAQLLAQNTPATLPFDQVNKQTRAATVNILCLTTVAGGPLKSVTGSGVIIDPRGVVLTNAHVAEYFLLKNYFAPNYIDCSVRTGSPAQTTYKARLLWISPAWISANTDVLTQTTPTGTGENDFALLELTDLNGNALTSPIPSVQLDEQFGNPPPDQSVALVAYPAEFTRGLLVFNNLNQVSSMSTISKGFYFDPNHQEKLDLIDVGNTVLSQEGSSGGAVVDLATGKLVGILVIVTQGLTTGNRELFAITSAHIIDRFASQSKTNLDQYLAQNLNALADQFTSAEAPQLQNEIESVLLHQ